MAPTEKIDAEDITEIFAKRCLDQNHAARAVTRILETESFFPTAAALVQACEFITASDATEREEAQNAELAQARTGCRYCAGTGFRVIEGECGVSGATPCSHNAATESARVLQVRMNPAVAKRYHEEMRQADERRIGWLKNRHQNPQHGFKPVTQDDVNDALRNLYEKRGA